MALREDCVNFGYRRKEITGLGDRQKRFMDIPKCAENKMEMGGCPENCQFYEST